jgi:hypothetical protein
MRVMSSAGLCSAGADSNVTLDLDEDLNVCGSRGWSVGQFVLSFGVSGPPDESHHITNYLVWLNSAASATSSALVDATYTETRDLTVTVPASAIGGQVSFNDADDPDDPVRLGTLLGGPYTLTTTSYTWTHTQAPGADVFVAFVPVAASPLLETAQRVVIADAASANVAIEIEEVDEL